MSNLSIGQDPDDSELPARSVGGWGSVGLTAVLVLALISLIWSAMEPVEGVVENSPIRSRTVIHWRQGPVFGVAWSPDGRRLAASCFGPEVRVWHRDSGATTAHEGGSEQPRFALGWSEDSRQLMVSGLDMPIEGWELFVDNEETGTKVVRPADRAGILAALTRTSGARPIRLWGPSDKRFGLAPSLLSGRSANSIAFSTDGRFLATGGFDGLLFLVDAVSGEPRRTIEVDARGITAVSFSADGSKVATGGPGPVRIWEVESGREVARLGGERSGSATLGFSPDGSKLAVANWDGSIQIWELAKSTPTFKLRGHHGQILSLAWSPDGKTLASGGYDSTVRVWDLAETTSKIASN
jgi:WD40 repeat protein